MKTLIRSAAYVVGVLAGGNGHVLFLMNWPEDSINPELDAEVCSFCASRGLKHNTW
jgi:hypothetical protein